MKVFACPGCDVIDAESCGDIAASCNSEIDGQIFTQPSYSLLLCRNCGLYYKSDIADELTLSRYYARKDFRKWETPGLYPTEHAAIKILQRVPRRARILDYGCSSGRLLQRLSLEYECFGYEINAAAAAVASEKGIQMLSNPSEAAPRSLDAVVMVDVFEHLLRPTEVLEGLARLVKPGGLMVVVTGNADAPAFLEDLENFWYLRTIEHLIMLSRSYAEFLSRRVGARITDWVEVSHYGWNAKDQLRQRLRRFAYRSFHSSDRSPCMAKLPVLRRARLWTQPPAFTCTRDHVAVGMQIYEG